MSETKKSIVIQYERLSVEQAAALALQFCFQSPDHFNVVPKTNQDFFDPSTPEGLVHCQAYARWVEMNHLLQYQEGNAQMENVNPRTALFHLLSKEYPYLTAKGIFDHFVANSSRN